jgi:hypothetical protein
MQSVSSAYRSRAEQVVASEERDADDVVEADTLEHDTHDLTDEQKFVGGVDVKKDAESEEDFLATPGAEDGDDGTEPGDEDPLPKESWKRDDIVAYLVDHEVIESADDVEGQTKAELIDNFVG